jgi:hypothetical protein
MMISFPSAYKIPNRQQCILTGLSKHYKCYSTSDNKVEIELFADTTMKKGVAFKFSMALLLKPSTTTKPIILNVYEGSTLIIQGSYPLSALA